MLASGGLDSCILLGRLLEEGRAVQPFYVRFGLVWEEVELAALRRFIQRLGDRIGKRPAELVTFSLPLDDLYEGHWSLTGRGVPDETTPDEAVFLPGRNALLAIKPILWCQLHGISELALATLQSNPFPDATDDFFAALETAMSRGTAAKLQIVRPLGAMHKADVMRLGRDYPLELSFSCIAFRCRIALRTV